VNHLTNPLGEVSIAVFLGVLLAYLLDRLGLPPFLGFFLAGAIIGEVLGVSLPGIYLQVLLALVAFEVGRQLGTSGLSPAAFFAALIEAALIFGFSIAVFRLGGFSIAEALVVAAMMLSSSSILTYNLTQTLPEAARAIALSLTTLEDAVLFFALSLLLGGATPELLPVNLVVIIAISGAALGVFTYVYRYIVGREYALPFALAMAFGFVYVIQQFQLASPYLGAFIGGYLFSRADTHGVHVKEAAALSGLIIYLYMLVVGISIPTPAVNPIYFALSLLVALVAVFIRAAAVFLSALFTTGQPRLSAGVAMSMAHISELSLSIPVVAYTLGVVKSAELAFALAVTPIFTMFLAPLAWKRRGAVEDYVAARIRELRTTVAYEKLYKVVTHAFITATKLAVVSLAVALAVAYLGVYALAVLAPASYFLVKYSREIYKDLLIALREFEEARYTSIAILTSTLALATYVVFALIAKLGELHLYVSLAVVAVLTLSLYVIYSELSTKRFDKSI